MEALERLKSELKNSHLLSFIFPGPFNSYQKTGVAKGLMQSSPWPRLLFIQLVETSGVKDQNGMSLELAGAGLKQPRPVLPYPDLNRSQQNLLCCIQLAFQSTEHLCPCSCLGAQETLHGVSFFGDVS